jgi:hypothetical protein
VAAASTGVGNPAIVSASDVTAATREKPAEPVAPPAEGTVQLDDKIKFSTVIDLDAGTIKFEVTYAQSNGWFGLGASKDGTMTSSGEGSDVVLCTSDGVQRFWMTAKSKPSGGKDVSGATCERSGDTSVLTFTRDLKAGSEQREMKGAKGETTNIIYAYHSSSDSLTFHTKKGSSVIELAAGGVGDAVALPVPALVTAHAVFMLLSWGLILPAGVVIARTQRNNPAKVQGAPLWFGLHRILQYTGWTLQLAGFGIILAYKDGSHFESSLTVGVTHMFAGLIVVILGTLQPLNAFLRPHNPPKGEPKSKARVCWEYLHKGSGYLATTGGMINCLLGGITAAAYNYEPAFYLSVEVVIGLSMAVVVFYTLYKKITGSGAGAQKNPSPAVADSPDVMINPARASVLSQSMEMAPTNRNRPAEVVAEEEPATGTSQGKTSLSLNLKAAPPKRKSRAVPRGTLIPDNWKRHVDAAGTGRSYYEKPDGSVQWEKPPGNEGKQVTTLSGITE